MNRIGKLAVAVLLGSTALGTAVRADGDDNHHGAIKHVLLISVDGMHEVHLQRYVQATRHRLSPGCSGTVCIHQRAHLTPIRSFPGLLAFMTGASPRTHGVFYDDTYDHTLYPPASNCQGPAGPKPPTSKRSITI